MDDEKVIDEWADSFEVGTDVVDTPEVEEAPEVDTPDAPEPEEAPEAPEEPAIEEGPSEQEEPTEEAPKEEEPAVEEPKLTRDDIKSAVKEVESERASYVEEIKHTAKEVLDTFYPQGIDRQLRDKDGDPIKGIDDVMNLIDPRTGENFTEEAAGRWLLENQQALNKQVEELEASAERVAEVNVNLKNDAHRVVEKYGDILTKNPDVAADAKRLYEQTLRKDPKSGITLEAPVDLIGFYDSFMKPYLSQPAPVTPAPAPPAPVPEPAPESPDDRADLPPTNGNDNLSREDREWADIAKDYQSQRN
jgi:hypothetical protein